MANSVKYAPETEDFYENTRGFDKTFRSFKSSVTRGAKDLATLAPVSVAQSRNLQEDVGLFISIINILFPVAAGSCLPIEQLWAQIEGLAAGKSNSEEIKKFKEKISKILRVYYYNGNPDLTSDPLETKIRDFYVKNAIRPSAYSSPESSKNQNPDGTLLREMIGRYDSETLENTAKLSMILVDTPIIDVKLRSTEKVDAFINYSPTMLISQCVPYVDARFVLRRVAPDDPSIRSLNFMSSIKFLMDASEQIKPATANALLYDSSVLRKLDPSATANQSQIRQENDAAKLKAAGKKAAAPGGTGTKAFTPESAKIDSNATSKTDGIRRIDKNYVSGMENFLSPQTLLNMDFDQTTTRFNPIRNPTLPFGTIVDFKVNVVPSVGIMSFKTATLTLKVFDRSRLVEIADFINPKLYQSATIWMTYGWRGPQQSFNSAEENAYIKFINENMMIREAYGIRNTTVAIDDAGVATLTLSLFTKGTAELADVVTDGLGQIFDNNQSKIENDMAELSSLLKQLGLESYSVGGADIRGSVLINSANGGTFPDIDAAQYRKEMDALLNALSSLSGPKAKEAAEKVKALFSITSQAKDAKPQAVAASEKIAKTISATRFLPLTKTTSKDIFSYFPAKFEKDADGMPGKKPLHRLAEITNAINVQQGDALIDPVTKKEVARDFQFGSTSFGRVFLNYFQQLSTGINGVIDEFQIVFYRFNSRAGLAASMNIAEFPIDMAILLKAYTNRITEQKGEKMSVMNFLELVRECQFNEMSHRAYGFSKFFQYKDGKVIRSEGEQSQKEFIKATLQNVGNAGSFVQPTIDFFIETSYSQQKPGEGAPMGTDLLKRFETASLLATTGRRDPEVKKIMRIHVYDKASTPHAAAATIMKQNNGGKYYSVPTDAFKQVLDDAQKVSAELLQKEREATKAAVTATALAKAARNQGPAEKKRITAVEAEATAKARAENSLERKLKNAAGDSNDPAGATNKVLADAGYGDIKVEVFDFGSPASFQKVKNKIAEFVPTILIGSNGTAVQNVSYSSNQDALLSTIMMLRSNTKDANPAEANGSRVGGLPLRVIPGQLTLTTLGCPLIEYMQQFFVDLGTGTTIDNLYNITGLTHNFSPGKFSTEIKFSFYDAYGQYESPQAFGAGFETLVNKLNQENELAKKAGRK